MYSHLISPLKLSNIVHDLPCKKYNNFNVFDILICLLRYILDNVL